MPPPCALFQAHTHPLQDILLQRAPELRVLNIRGYRGDLGRLGRLENSWPDFSLLPHLECLELQDKSGTIRNSLDAPIPKLPRDLQVFSFTPCLKPVRLRDINSYAFLTSLTLFEGSRLEESNIRHMLFSSKDSLRTLFLQSAHWRSVDFEFPQLRVMHLVECFLDDLAVQHLCEQTPKLEELDLTNNVMVTGVGVKRVVQKQGAKVTKLNLTKCELVNVDAVKWARKQGVSVSFVFPG